MKVKKRKLTGNVHVSLNRYCRDLMIVARQRDAMAR
jgi:hypothetical protein